MKDIIKLFILLIFLSSSLFAEIDERQVDLYYANGMFGDSKKNEIKAWDRYVEALKKSNPNINQTVSPKIVYNSHTLWGADDIVEVMFQKLVGDTISWAKTQDYLQAYIVENEIIEAVNILSQAFNLEDLATHVKSYKESINAGHGVVVVAQEDGEKTDIC